MATDLVNPAASGGFNFGDILSKTLNAYQNVSIARIERDTARYNAAGAVQAAALHSPEGYTGLEAFGIGNAVNPAAKTTGTYTAGGIPKTLLWVGGLAVAGLLVWKAVK